MASGKLFILLLTFGCLLQLCQSKLALVISLSRHGSRAPNPVVRRICPNAIPNINKYSVPLEQLTEVGMNQLVAFGKYMRQEYVFNRQFLAESLNIQRPNNSTRETKNFESYFRSDAATRCAQSALCTGYGLYPHGPKSFPIQPISVVQQLLPNEVTFAAPKNLCHSTLQADLRKYADTRARELFSTKQNSKLLDQLSLVCGVDPEDYASMPGGEDKVLGIKDIADAFLFELDEELDPVPGVTTKFRQALRQLQFQMLMERYYSTKRMITYWCGGFPQLILDNLQEAVLAIESNTTPPTRYYSYHGHRELLYGLSMMLGWPLDFDDQPVALNQSAIPPATSFIFELHSPDEGMQGSYYVKMGIWSPKTGRKDVTLKNCSSECPLPEFVSIIQNHIKETGTWEQICNVEESFSSAKEVLVDDTQVLWLLLSLNMCCLLVNFAGYFQTRRRRDGYNHLNA